MQVVGAYGTQAQTNLNIAGQQLNTATSFRFKPLVLLAGLSNVGEGGSSFADLVWFSRRRFVMPFQGFGQGYNARSLKLRVKERRFRWRLKLNRDCLMPEMQSIQNLLTYWLLDKLREDIGSYSVRWITE